MWSGVGLPSNVVPTVGVKPSSQSSSDASQMNCDEAIKQNGKAKQSCTWHAAACACQRMAFLHIALLQAVAQEAFRLHISHQLPSVTTRCSQHHDQHLLGAVFLHVQAAKQKAAELEVKRKEHLRAVLMGQNFIESGWGYEVLLHVVLLGMPLSSA